MQYASKADTIQSRLEAGALDSSLNFPLFDGVTDAFQKYDMEAYVDAVMQVRAARGA